MRAANRYAMGTSLFLCALLAFPTTLAARTITVDNDAPADFTTIQAAIDDANDADEVVISPGTYTGPGNRDIDFNVKNITVRSIASNDPNVVAATVIDCNEQGRGFYLDGCDNASIEGLTITNGLAEHGGGIYIEDSNATISYCRVVYNKTQNGKTADYELDDGGHGGGICCTNSHVSISDSIINNNATGHGENAQGGSSTKGGFGGGIYADRASLLDLHGCTLADNTTGDGGDVRYSNWPDVGGHGGGVYSASDLPVVLDHCVVTGNVTGQGGTACAGQCSASSGSGGGIYCRSAIVKNSVIGWNATGEGRPAMFDEGSSGSGGGIYCSSIAIDNTQVSANSTGSGGRGGNGGGIRCSSGSISNCTIVENGVGVGESPDSQTGRGAGIWCGNDTSIINSIIWDNSDDQIFGCDCNSVSYCDIQYGNCIGFNGNISADPLFTFAPLGQYYLRQVATGHGTDSPCVDAGSDMAASLGMDIYTTRTDKLWDQGIVDMGYHYRQTIADLNDDGVVNMKDVAILGSQWQQSPAVPSADIVPTTIGDGQVDIHDLALLAEWWLWPW